MLIKKPMMMMMTSMLLPLAKRPGSQVVSAPILVSGSNPTGGEIQLITKWPFTTHQLSVLGISPAAEARTIFQGL